MPIHDKWGSVKSIASALKEEPKVETQSAPPTRDEFAAEVDSITTLLLRNNKKPSMLLYLALVGCGIGHLKVDAGVSKDDVTELVEKMYDMCTDGNVLQ